MKRIRELRKSIERNRTRLTDMVIGMILGVVVIPLASILLRFYARLPEGILIALCLIQSIAILILTFCLVVLRDRLASRETFIERNHPGMDIDAEEEYEKAYNDACNKLEKK
jgi:cobalamin biosynthesis protein CobD/CbiB